MHAARSRRGGTSFRRIGVAVGLAILPVPSFAQGPAPDMQGAPAQTVGKGAVDPGQGGVGGTGLGKTTGTHADGMGQSVPGPPGQGIDGMAVNKPDVTP